MTDDELLRHLPLIRSIINRHFRWSINQRIDICDLMQEGFIGLHRAAVEHDPSRSSFCNFAFFKIRHAIADYVNNQFTSLTTRSNNFTTSPERLTPTAREAALACSRCVSLNSTATRRTFSAEGMPSQLIDQHDDLKQIEQQEHAQKFQRLCQDHLRPREMYVLSGVASGLKMREIAESMGVSQQRVSGIKNCAKRRISEFWKEPAE